MDQEGAGPAHEDAPVWDPGTRDDKKAQIIDQIRELGTIMARSRMQTSQSGVGRAADAADAEGSDDGASGATRSAAQQAARTVAQPAARRTTTSRYASAFRGQGRLLTLLALVGEASQRDLGRLLGMSRQAVGELLAKLEARGLVEREASPQDHRTMSVRLTGEGMRAAERLHDAPGMGFDLLSCLNDEELATLSDYLARIIGHAEELYPRDDYLGRRRMMRRALEEFRLASHLSGGRGDVLGGRDVSDGFEAEERTAADEGDGTEEVVR